jgi:hypothetical protein
MRNLALHSFAADVVIFHGRSVSDDLVGLWGLFVMAQLVKLRRGI